MAALAVLVLVIYLLREGEGEILAVEVIDLGNNGILIPPDNDAQFVAIDGIETVARLGRERDSKVFFGREEELGGGV